MGNEEKVKFLWEKEQKVISFVENRTQINNIPLLGEGKNEEKSSISIFKSKMSRGKVFLSVKENVKRWLSFNGKEKR